MMRVPEFILSEFKGYVDQSAYLFFCENEVEVSSDQAAANFLVLRKLAVILYEWIDNDNFDLRSEYREVLDSKKMLPIIEETITQLTSVSLEIITADPHNDTSMFLNQIHASFTRVQSKENQFEAWSEFLNGGDPKFKDIPYSFEGSELQTCSFCDKTTEEVENIIAGPKAKICNECVGLCNNVLAEEDPVT